jgi:hypothetical protein
MIFRTQNPTRQLRNKKGKSYVCHRTLTLEGLVELKLGAGRAKDIADIIELIRHNPDSLQAVHNHLSSIHPQYCTRFQQLVIQAEEEQ